MEDLVLYVNTLDTTNTKLVFFLSQLVFHNTYISSDHLGRFEFSDGSYFRG